MVMTTEQLWEDFHVPLRQFIRAQVRDEAQTDDLLQEVSGCPPIASCLHLD
ncbi:MAG TPA: hypothetical protein VKT82_00125 [Ktedonobacterales bacterium]|nr:hypothetical protein [Ktedonobacterales bacterium]